MRTCNYIDILTTTAQLAFGQQPSELAVEDFRTLRTFHDRRLKVAWEIHEWAEVMRYEQRYFRPLYSTSASYTPLTDSFEVFYPPTGRYYQCTTPNDAGSQVPALADGSPNVPYWAESATSYTGSFWASLTAYTVGVQVRNPGDNRAYACITAHTSGVSFDASKFCLLTEFDRYVDYEQAGQTAIGEMVGMWDRDPRATTKATRIDFDLSADGFQVRVAVPFVWTYFRVRRPVIKGESYSATAFYETGQQIYFRYQDFPGNMWDYIAGDAPAPVRSPANDEDGTVWRKVEIPYIFQEYIAQGAYADWLRSDGQEDKATEAEAEATGFLELEADKWHRQQKQTRRLNYRH